MNEFIKQQEEKVTHIMEELVRRQKEEGVLKEELHEISDELTKLERLAASLRAKRQNIEEQLRKNRFEQRANEQKKRVAERELQVAHQQAQLIEDFKMKSEELDALTASAPWREWAFDYQIDGAKTLAVAQKAILADKRGLGKTVTGGVVYLDMVGAQRVLLVAPNDVVTQFEGELRHWAPHRKIFPLSGLNPDSRKLIYPMLATMPEFVATINYEAWRRDKSIIDKMVDIGFDTVVCDEAHRAKSSSKVTARGIFWVVLAKNYCPSCKTKGSLHAGNWYVNGEAQDKDWNGNFRHLNPRRCEGCGTLLESTVKNVLPMTGTPILNKPQEMFSLLYMTYPELFSSESAFLNTYCYQYAPGKWRFMYGGEERLFSKISRFFVQRSREDVGSKVPPPAIIHHELDFDAVKYPKQFQAYQNLNKAAALILENGEGKPYVQNTILQIIMRSRQIQTWPAGIQLRDPETNEIVCNFDVHESQKLDAVEELVRELIEEGERPIVWSQFKGPLEELERRLNNKESWNGNADNFRPVALATGDVSKEYRTNVIYPDFDLKTASKDNYRFSALLATYKAVGTGLNLNASRQAVILDQEWNPGMEDQAIGRIDRINSQDQATVHIFQVTGTVDTFMANLIEEKRKLVSGFEEVVVSASDILNAIREGNM